MSAGVVLADVQRVKRFLGIAEETHDALLADLINGVSATLQSYIGRQITTTRVTDEYHDGGFYHLTLEHAPVISVEAVREDDTLLVAGTDYEVDLAAGLLLKLSGTTPTGFDKSLRRFAVDYTYGWSTVPEDLQAAATKQIAHEWKQTSPGGARVGLISESSEVGQTLSFIQGALLPDVATVCDSYRALV